MHSTHDKSQNSPENSELLFLFGKDAISNRTFRTEMRENGDFIIGDFSDTYQNLPLKTLSGYTYLNKYCDKSYPKWIVFQDDDTFVDNPKLAQFLQTKSAETAQFFCPRRIAAADRTGQSNPHLKKDHALIVNDSLWDLDYYPVYCAGPCTIMSAPTAAAIYSTALRTNWRRFPIEDVLFTGIIRHKANLPQPPCCFNHKEYCTHYNDHTKYEDLKSRVEDYIENYIEQY